MYQNFGPPIPIPVPIPQLKTLTASFAQSTIIGPAKLIGFLWHSNESNGFANTCLDFFARAHSHFSLVLGPISMLHYQVSFIVSSVPYTKETGPIIVQSPNY